MNSEERDKRKDKILLSQREIYLLKGYFNKALSEEEMEELDHWLMRDESNLKLFEDLLEREEIDSGQHFLEQLSYKPENRKAAFKILAAAIVVFVGVSVALYYFVFRAVTLNKPAVNYAETTLDKSSEIRLITGLGDEIPLHNYSVVPAYKYIKYDTASGILEYSSNQSGQFDTLHVPPGRMVQLRLSDGTGIWVNASSKLVFPASAEIPQRRVELDGEAYFEVAARAGSVFQVKAGDLVVEAIGTSFNINTGSVQGIETALLDGRVRIKVADIGRNLIPGKTLSWKEGRFAENKLDTGKISGWRENQFVFRHSPISAVLKEIEKWYGVKTVGENISSFSLNATIPRTTPLPRLLDLLEQTGHARFHLNRDTIWVKNWSSE